MCDESLGHEAKMEILCNIGERETQCKYCGLQGLVWKDVLGHWKLFDKRIKGLHVCASVWKQKAPKGEG